MVHSPNDALQTHTSFSSKLTKGQGRWAKSLKNPGHPEKLSLGRGGGGPLWDISTYLHHHRRDITQTFMVDSPSDNLQTHKVSGRNSSRGRVSGPDRSRARATCGALRVRPADRWSRVRATCGSLQPCACDLGTTRTVRTRPADHWSRARATC